MKCSIKNINTRSHTKAVMSIVLSLLIIIGVFLGVVENLLIEPNELVQEVGVKTFRMFTVLSNMLMAITAALSIPFAVDGIRYKNYHLPKWIASFLFSGTVCVGLTFFIALFVLSPQVSFYRIMLYGSNFQLHTLVPILALILFIFINDFHRISFKISLYGILPIAAYAAVYTVSGIFIGEHRGGWRDHYQFQKLMPWYIAFVLIILIAFLLATAIRLIHNAVHKREKALTERYYQNDERYLLPTVEDAITKLAKEHREFDKGGDIIVPRRIIRFLENKYKSGRPINDLCNIYINAYLNK